MSNTRIGPLLTALASLLAADVAFDPIGSFLFAEMQDRKLSCAIYQKVGGEIAEEPCSREVLGTIRLIRQLAPTKERWSTFAYHIRPETFHVDYGYSDQQPAGELPEQRRARAVKAWADGYAPADGVDEDAEEKARTRT